MVVFVLAVNASIFGEAPRNERQLAKFVEGLRRCRASRATRSPAGRRSTPTARSCPRARPRALPQALPVRTGNELMALDFGVTVLPDPPFQRLVDLVVKAESLGFDSGLGAGLPDPVAGAVPAHHAARRPHFDHADRHVRDQPGRARAGGHGLRPRDAAGHLGRPDGARDRARATSAVRVMGREPTPIAMFEERCAMIKAFMNSSRGAGESARRSSSNGRRTSRRSRSTSPRTGRARWASPGGSPTA